MSLGLGQIGNRTDVLLTRILLGQKRTEPIEFPFPGRTVVSNPLIERAKTRRFNAAGSDAAQLFRLHEPGRFENLQMLGDGGERDAQRFREPRDRRGTHCQPVEERAASGISKRVK